MKIFAGVSHYSKLLLRLVDSGFIKSVLLYLIRIWAVCLRNILFNFSGRTTWSNMKDKYFPLKIHRQTWKIAVKNDFKPSTVRFCDESFKNWNAMKLFICSCLKSSVRIVIPPCKFRGDNANPYRNDIYIHIYMCKSDIKNHRPITLFSHLYKVFMKVIALRFNDVLEEHQRPNQAGFSNGYSTTDYLFVVYQLIEKSQCTILKCTLVFGFTRKLLIALNIIFYGFHKI